MILKRISVLILILFCFFNASAQINCDNDTSGLIPIVDLQTGIFMGYQGGLYPGGSNIITPSHADSGIAIAQNLLPINFDGETDTVYGKLIMVGLGPSSASHVFNKFISAYQDAGFSDSCFRIINGCMDEYGLNDMVSDSADDIYWKELNDKFQIAGLKKKQVTIVWLMSTSFSDTITTMSAYIDTLTTRYVDVIRKMKDEFPNLKLIYLSGLHYGGYISLNAEKYKYLAEPAPYYNDFAIKAVIESQINGDSLLNYSGVDADAAWLAWGPNIWADGRNFRNYDNLRWLCPGDYDAGEDGFLLDGTGLQKVSDRLYDFFSTDATTTPWFFGLPFDCFTETDTNETIDTTVIPEGEIVWIVQNPVKSVVKFTINLTTDGKADVIVFDALGRKVAGGAFFKIEPGRIFDIKLDYNLHGIYILSVLVENKVYNVPFYLDW